MVFSEVFIKKPIMTTLVMVAVLISGFVAYFYLPVSDLPVVEYPVITISAIYPGASPSMMANTVAKPLEDECMQIQGLETIISDNTEGQTQIMLTFDLSLSVDLAAPDVQAAISRAQANLPDDLPQPPTYQKTNPSEKPIVHISVTSDTLTDGQLFDFGNTAIGKRLSMINGVSQVDVWGAQSAMRIQVDPDKLAAFNIGIDEVANALKAGTVIIPGGSLDGKFSTFSIEPQGQLFEADEYEKLIVAYRNNAPIYLGDIANCLKSTQNDVIRVMHFESEQGWRSAYVHIAVTKESGANTVSLAKEVRQTLQDLKGEIPGSVDVSIFYDQSISIIASVKDVKNTIFIAIVLVVLVIFMFLGRLSDTVIPSITLPLTIFGTFAAMLVMGFSLDNLSLMGLTLSVGFLVDDAIVVLENTVRHVEEGMKPLKAAVKSMREITGTVISTSIALIIVFVPLVFMGGVVGRLFRELAITVVAAICCSTLISLTLTPMMCARMLKEGKKDEKTRVQLFIDKHLGALIKKYGVALRWTLERKFICLIVWVLCIAGSLWFISLLPKTFIPEGDSGAVMGLMQLPLGASTDQARTFQDAVDKILHENQNINGIVSATGLNVGADQSTGLFYAILYEKNRQPIAKVVDELRAKMAMLPYGFVFIEAIPALTVSTGGESTAQGCKYSYLISGSNRDDVYKASLELEQRMRALPGFCDIQNSVKLDMPQLNIRLLRDRASTLGITAQDIEYGLSLAYAEGKINLYKTDIDQYWVIVELEKQYQMIPENMHHIYLRSSVTNKLVPLSSLIDWDLGVGPQNVPHYDQLNSATLSFNLTPGFALGTATTSLSDLSATILPAGVGGIFQGEAQEFTEAVKSMAKLLIVAVFLLYIVLGILYESYIHPFTILTTLPVAAFGGLLTLIVFRAELSLYAYIGIFMLLGIVSKNGIIMIDFAEQYLKEGDKTSFDAIYNACLVRFRPILMTGASTIMGALPIALGFGADGASRRPLGLIVAGGLVFAQVVTLFVTPGIYLYMQNFQEKYLDRWELSRSAASRKDDDDDETEDSSPSDKEV